MYALMLTYLISTGVQDGDAEVGGTFTEAQCKIVTSVMKTEPTPPGYTRVVACVDQATLDSMIATRGCRLIERPIPLAVYGKTTLWHYGCSVS